MTVKYLASQKKREEEKAVATAKPTVYFRPFAIFLILLGAVFEENVYFQVDLYCLR